MHTIRPYVISLRRSCGICLLGFYSRFRLVRENLELVLFPMSFYYGQVSDFIGGLSGTRYQQVFWLSSKR